MKYYISSSDKMTASLGAASMMGGFTCSPPIFCNSLYSRLHYEQYLNSLERIKENVDG
jgi:hypothetical protein